MEQNQTPTKLGNIHLVSYNNLNYTNLSKIKSSFALDVDEESSGLSNPFGFNTSKQRKLALERYHNFFHSNLEEAENLQVYIALSSIETALEQGQDVYLLTSVSPKHSHGKTILEYFQTKLERGEIKFQPTEEG